MSKSYADVLESYVIAEEGFFSNLYNRLRANKVNKAKITVMKEKMSKQKSATTVATCVKYLSPKLVSGPDGMKVIKEEVQVQRDADGNAYADPNKLSSKDYIVKTVNGVAVAYLPGSPEDRSVGISLLIVPVRMRNGGVEAVLLIENEIAKTLVEGPLPSESDESVSIGH